MGSIRVSMTLRTPNVLSCQGLKNPVASNIDMNSIIVVHLSNLHVQTMSLLI